MTNESFEAFGTFTLLRPIFITFLSVENDQQKSAEVYALQIQSYNVSKECLDKYLNGKKGEKLPSITIYLDETVLDNMAFPGFNR